MAAYFVFLFFFLDFSRSALANPTEIDFGVPFVSSRCNLYNTEVQRTPLHVTQEHHNLILRTLNGAGLALKALTAGSNPPRCDHCTRPVCKAQVGDTIVRKLFNELDFSLNHVHLSYQLNAEAQVAAVRTGLQKCGFHFVTWRNVKFAGAIACPFYIAKRVTRNGITHVYLVFRGSDSVMDWISDLDFSQITWRLGNYKMRVHEGFARLVTDLRIETMLTGDLAPAANVQYHCIGHSLGGAVAQLACLKLTFMKGVTRRPSIVTFGSPRAGDVTFATALTTRCDHIRIRHNHDPVPLVPRTMRSARLLSIPIPDGLPDVEYQHAAQLSLNVFDSQAQPFYCTTDIGAAKDNSIFNSEISDHFVRNYWRAIRQYTQRYPYTYASTN